MNFQYAHLNIKTNMVFIPNNIPYLKIFFGLVWIIFYDELCFYEGCHWHPHDTFNIVFQWHMYSTREKNFLWPYSVGRKMRKLNSAKISDVSSTCAGGTINRGPYKGVPGQLRMFYYPSGKVTSLMISPGTLSCTNGISIPCPSLRAVTVWLMTLASDT
jgi:hypothetical protein